MNIFFLVEMIGTVAFAWSGAMVAIQKRLDLLGVIVLGVVTAVGGGMFRDLLIGNTPPTLFLKPVYTAVAAGAVLVLFVTVYFRNVSARILASERYESIMNFLDAVGLGAFTVVGIDTAISAGHGGNHFLMVFLGVITGVGGGMLRDTMAGQTPAVLKKHIYACASLLGAESYVLLLKVISRNAAIVLSTVLVVIIRLLARHYKWNLPRISAPSLEQ